MSSYPPNQNPDSEINLDSMGPWQKAALFSNPKALQIMAYVQDIGARREEQQRRRELYKMEIEDRQRARAHDDFKTAIALHDSGFLPVHPGMVGQFEAGMGGRGTVTAPDMKQYSVPTEAQRVNAMALVAQRKGTSEGIEGRAKKNIEDPWTTIETDNPDVASGAFSKGTTRVRESQREAIAVARLKQKYPDAHIITQVDDNGDLHVAPTNGRTGQPLGKPYVVPRAGKTKTERADKEALPSNDEVEALMNDWRTNFYNSRGITPDVLQSSKGMSKDPITQQPTANPAAARIDAAEKELRDAATKEVASRIRNSGSGVTMSKNFQPLSESQQKQQTALANYRKLPAEQRDKSKPGVKESPRAWFLRTFGVDPDTIK